MTYELVCIRESLDEWCKPYKSVRDQFKKKLEERLLNPRVPAARLSGQKDRFKIKLRQIGYRLVYEVQDSRLVVLVVAVGKRERNAAYKTAAQR
jgi:mRNA interferase RelE/StbE